MVTGETQGACCCDGQLPSLHQHLRSTSTCAAFPAVSDPISQMKLGQSQHSPPDMTIPFQKLLPYPCGPPERQHSSHVTSLLASAHDTAHWEASPSSSAQVGSPSTANPHLRFTWAGPIRASGYPSLRVASVWTTLN